MTAGLNSPSGRGIHILFVCTGNIFRSPMAQAFLTKISEDRHLALTAESAGTLPGDRPMSLNALDVIGTEGADMSRHHSRLLDAQLVGRADIVLGMAREHVREIVLLDTSSWPRTFTLKELVRRGEAVGPLARHQDLSRWLEALGDGRRREDLLGWSSEDDVADPMDGTPEDFRATGAELLDLVRRLADLIDAT